MIDLTRLSHVHQLVEGFTLFPDLFTYAGATGLSLELDTSGGLIVITPPPPAGLLSTLEN